jgi:hypothetical protein
MPGSLGIKSSSLDNAFLHPASHGAVAKVHFTPFLIEAPPPPRRLSATTNIQMVYDASGVSAVWSIGEDFCKVKILDPGTTREHGTLDYFRNKRPLSFATPDVHYRAEYDGRYYIILSSLTGQTC